MSITRDQVRRAIENYLPSSLTVSQDAQTSTVDPEEVFAKLQTLVASAVVTDPNSVYYLISLSIAELTDFVEQSFAAIDALASKDILFSAEQSDPTDLISSSDLQRALGALAGLSTDSGSQSSEEFNSAIEAFQTAQLNALVERRNLALIDKEIQSQALILSTAVADIKTYVDRIEAGLSSIESADVKKLAVQNVAAAVSTRVSQIRAEIDSGEGYADKAETYMVDLVAAKAVISILMSSSDFRGTTVISPKSNALTLKTYLSVQGTADITPQQYVARGGSGRPLLDYIYASRGGNLSATALQVTAYLESEEDLSFPLTITSGVLVFDVNGQTETVNLSGTFTTLSDLVLGYNAVSTLTTAAESGQRIRIHAYSTDSDPVGKDSSIELLSSSDAGAAGLHILPGKRSVGSLIGNVLSDSIVTLSDYTFPTKTITDGPVSVEQFECFVLTLAGTIHQITAVDTSSNTLSIQPGIQLEVVSGGTTTYEITGLSYLVLNTTPGTLFSAGSGSKTTKTTDNPSGIDLNTFLPASAGTTGSTGSSVVREPYYPVQAVGRVQAQDNTLMVPGLVVQIKDDLFELVPNGTPPGPNQFEIGVTELETAANLKAAIDAAESTLSDFMTASLDPSNLDTVLLTASTQNYQGSSGNTLPTPIVPAGFLAVAFSGGLDAGDTWSGNGVYGSMETITRLSGSDGTNQKESGTSAVGQKKWSGTSGIAFKGYGSGTGSNWYAAASGTWGETVDSTTGSAGDSPTLLGSPNPFNPDNVVSFKSGTGSQTEWQTSDAQIFWHNNSGTITAGMWFRMTAWSEYTTGTSGNLTGPTTGIGYGVSTGNSGTGDTVLYISAISGANNQNMTVKAPNINVSGSPPELGETWQDFGWATSDPGFSVISMTGSFLNPDKFTTVPNSFTNAYTTETGYFVPQAGDTIYLEKEISGTVYRSSQTIASIGSGTSATLNDSGGTYGANDLAFARRASFPNAADYPAQQTSVKYTLVRDASTAQTRFFASSATSTVNLSSKGVSAGDLLHITSAGSNNGWYIIKSVSSDGELLIDSSASGNAPDNTAFKTSFSYPEKVSWEIVAADYQQRITDSSATFLTNGVSVGDTMVISSGSFAGNYEIDAVESETSILVDATNPSYKGGPFTAADTPTYYVPTNDILGGEANKFFRSPGSYFYGNVFSGDILNVGSTDYVVDEISSSDTLTLTTNFSSYFSGQAFTIRQGVATSGDYSGQEVTDRFSIDLSANAGLTDLKDVGGIEVDDQIDVDITSGSDVRDGFLKITSDSGTTTHPIASVEAVDGVNQVIVLGEEIPLSTTGTGPGGTLSWQVLAGTTTPTFLDTGSVDSFIFSSSSTSEFYTHQPGAGDTLIISPGEAGEVRMAIASVDTAKQLTLEEEVDQGLTGLRYGILPAEYPQIGQELLVSGYRAKITDVTLATSGSTTTGVLALDSAVPLSIGAGASYFVVTAGGDPSTSSIEDADPDVTHDSTLTLDDGFLTTALGDLVGRRVQISSGVEAFSARISRVPSSTVLELSRPLNTAAGEVFYRVMTAAQGKSKQISHPTTISESLETEDTLTIWQVTGTHSNLSKTTGTTTSGTPYTTISFAPEVDSNLSNLDFAVTRGGGSGYGRYVLLLNKLSEITSRLDDYKFADLNLRLGEVLSTHGTDTTDIMSSGGGSPAARAIDDGDGDTLTNRFDVSINASHDLGGIRIGDRVEIVYEDSTGASTTYVAWVTLGERGQTTNTISQYDDLLDGFAGGTTRCLVSPEIPITSTDTIVSWKIQRNSISFALFEGTRLRLLLESLRQVIQYYSVNTSTRIDVALQLLRDEGYDRMGDLLISGQYADFFAASYEDGSYQESMKKVMRDIGNLLLDLRNG